MAKDDNLKQPVRKDPFSRMMFSAKSEESIPEEVEGSNPESESNIDYMKLMESVDTLMTVFSDLKPQLQKMSPVLIRLLTKLGSEKK